VRVATVEATIGLVAGVKFADRATVRRRGLLATGPESGGARVQDSLWRSLLGRATFAGTPEVIGPSRALGYLSPRAFERRWDQEASAA
jgi:hypothetical protein